MGESHVHMATCPKCGKKATEFNEQGKHNFCPASEGDKIVNLCMECKMRDISLSWWWSGM